MLSPGEPKVVDQLIMALGLGGRGQHITPGGAPRRPAQPIPPARNFVPLSDQPVFFNESTPGRFTRSNCDDAKQVCLHVTTPRGKFKQHVAMQLLDLHVCIVIANFTRLYNTHCMSL